MRIKEFRKAKGMTQADLAKAAGITSVAICRYEKEHRKPNIFIAVKIANALGVTVEELIGQKKRKAG